MRCANKGHRTITVTLLPHQTVLSCTIAYFRRDIKVSTDATIASSGQIE